MKKKTYYSHSKKRTYYSHARKNSTRRNIWGPWSAIGAGTGSVDYVRKSLSGNRRQYGESSNGRSIEFRNYAGKWFRSFF